MLYHTHESSTSTEPSPISERKTFPRLEKQRYRGGPLDVSMDANRPIIKLSETGMRSYSTNASPSHLNNHARMSTYDRPKDSSERKSVESLCLLEDGNPARNYLKNSRYRHREKGAEWGNELSTLELKPPTGFTDAHETSEAECDIDMKLRLHRKRGGQNCQLSKSPQDFTITV